MPSSMLYVVVLAFLLFSSKTLSQGKGEARRAARNSANPLIVGKDAPKERFGYMCSLRHQGNHIHACGGKLVRHDWLMTAAHCVDPDLEGSVGLRPIVYCGIYRLDEDDPDKIFDVSRSHIHEEWNGKVHRGYDIALLRLNRNVTLPDLELPELDTGLNQLDSGAVLDALGWGATPTTGTSPVLQMTTNFQYLTTAECNKLWTGIVDKDTMICAGILGDDVCKGDSGGPLIRADRPRGHLTSGRAFRDLVVGITSFGYNEATCGESDRPGVFTRVAPFADWINNVLDGDGSEDSRQRSSTAPASQTAPGSDAKVLLEDLLPAELVEEMKTAFREDNADYAELILEEGLHVNTTLEATIPGVGLSRIPLLHGSAMFNAPKCAQVLINAGAAVESQISDYYGMKPLHVCGVFGSLEVAKVLLHRRNDAAVSSFDNIDDTPLHKAASHGHVELMEFLITKADMFYYNTFGDTPLHKAARAGLVDAVELLLERGASIDFKNDNDWTALHKASFNNHTEVVKALLRNGATVDMADEDYETPLHKACWRGHTEVIKLLLRSEARANYKDNEGYTAMHKAAWRGRIEAVKLLLRNGASLNVLSDDEYTPLQAAGWGGSAAVAELLLDNGASIDAVDSYGDTALHWASFYNHADVVKLLLSRGASVDARNDYKRTALHEASRRGSLAAVKTLLRLGADANAVDNDGYTPLHGAAENGHEAVIEVLLGSGSLEDY